MQAKLFLLLFLSWTGITTAQVVQVSTYHDPEKKTKLKEFYSVLATDQAVKHGIYRLFNEDGIVVTECGYAQGKETGKKVVRDERTAIIKYVGYFGNPEDYWSFLFLFDQNRKLSMTYECKEYGLQEKSITPARVERVIDSLDNYLRTVNYSDLPLYKDYISRNDFNIERLYMQGEDHMVLSQVGQFLLYRYFTLAENIKGFKENEQVIKQFAAKAEGVYKQKIPSVYEGKLRFILDDIARYDQNDSIEDRYRHSHILVASINSIDPLCGQSVVTDSLLLSRKAFLTQHYAGNINRLVLYNNRLLPALDSISKVYGPMDSLELRLQVGQQLLRSTEAYERRYAELEELDKTIEATKEPLFQKFAKFYPGAFATNLNHIRTFTGRYDTFSDINEKISFGALAARDLQTLSDQFDTLTRHQSFLSTTFPDAIDFYKNNQPNIYQNEVSPLVQKLEEYHKLDDLDDKIRQGSWLIAQAAYLCNSIGDIRSLDREIQQLLPLVKTNYQKNYKKIFKKEIEPEEANINNYRNIAQTNAKIEKGRELLRWLQGLDQKYGELQQQLVTIDSLITKNAKRYKKNYGTVNKKEISGIKTAYGDYKKAEILDLRLDKGRAMIEQLGFIDKSYDTIVKADSVIAGLLPLLKKLYKEDFPGIYESEIEDIKKRHEGFGKIAGTEVLLQTCRDLRQRAWSLRDKQEELKEQQKEVLQAHAEFLSLYKKNRDRKLVAKRGKTAYAFYFKQYQKARGTNESLDLGKDLVLLMKKINSYASDDCSYIIKQLKNISKPQDIRKLFVI